MKYFGYLAVAGLALAVALNFGDIRRYIKIEMM